LNAQKDKQKRILTANSENLREQVEVRIRVIRVHLFAIDGKSWGFGRVEEKTASIESTNQAVRNTYSKKMWAKI
jgi:hypothetical protein